MSSLRALVAVVAVLTSFLLGPAGVVRADDDDDTPQIDGFVEVRRYNDAATREILRMFTYVIGEVDRHPGNPSGDQMKKSNLRKRFLDLRLMVDFNMFAYKPSNTQRFRDLIDVAYEAVGEYKDLFDTQAIDGLPIDQGERDRRLNAMNNAVGPFRQADVRGKLEKAFDRYESEIQALDSNDRPRLWQIAQIDPTDTLDSAGNAARLGYAVLTNLRNEGLLVDDIFNPEQEARFHDVRKAMRSVLVLTDMFPSLERTVADAREPLSDLVKDYGKANDQVVAYHAAQGRGQVPDERIAGLTKAFTKAQKSAQKFVDEGQLDYFVGKLELAQYDHLR